MRGCLRRLVVALVLLCGAPLLAQSRNIGHRTLQTSNYYYTDFAGCSENPLSQGGRWIGAKTSGIDWNDMRCSSGLAYGNQDGLQGNGVYTDSVNILTGTWLPATTITTKIKATGQQTGNNYEEIEHWHRTTISYHSVKGYEVNFRNANDSGRYIGIVKWLGPFGGDGVQFTQLGSNCTSYTGISDNDILSSTITGTTTTIITAYVNGVQACQQQDTSSPYLTGNPGMGHWLHWSAGSLGNANDYGPRNYLVTAA